MSLHYLVNYYFAVISAVLLLHKLFTQITHLSPIKQHMSVTGREAVKPTAGKVTVSLASHWPCATHLSGFSICGLKA